MSENHSWKREDFVEFFLKDVLANNKNILSNCFYPCKILPTNYSNNTYILNDNKDSIDLDQEKYPPPYLTENYGSSIYEYRDSGDLTANAICAVIKNFWTNYSDDSSVRILDWGCASGRVLRFLDKYIKADTYGCDINANHIHWCQKYLNHKAKFTQCTTLPHLPFADGYFDVIYGLSIFTHISELIDMWFMELKRVIAKNGLLIITMHDDTTMKLVRDNKIKFLSDIIRINYNDIPETYDRFCAGDKSPFGNFMFFSDNNIENTLGKIFTIKAKLTSMPDDPNQQLSSSIGQFQTTYVLENSK